MSQYNEFQGALDAAKAERRLSDEDHKAFSDGSRTAFLDELDPKTRDAKRIVWLQMIVNEDWPSLRLIFGGQGVRGRPQTPKDVESVQGEAGNFDQTFSSKGTVLRKDEDRKVGERSMGPEGFGGGSPGDPHLTAPKAPDRTGPHDTNSPVNAPRENATRPAKPTVGLKVLFTPSKDAEPQDAEITFVHSPKMVDLRATDENGKTHNHTSVAWGADEDGKGRTWDYV